MYKHLASSGGGITPEPQGYKLTLLDFDGNKVTELNNVTNVANAIESSGVNLDVTNNVWLNLKYVGIEDESGNEITEINQDTTAYIRYENVGMHKDEAGENTVCITVVWDNGINTFAADLGQSYIYDQLSSGCARASLIKYLANNSWGTYSTTTQNHGKYGPTAAEFYIDKDDATNAQYQNYLNIQMATDSNNDVLINSNLYIVTPKEHNITTIFLRGFNYKWKEEQIHYICNKSDLQPGIAYGGWPEPC